MKILLTTINSRYSHPNLAIRYLREINKNPDYKIVIKEFTIKERIDDIIDEIVLENPEILAFSVYIWNSEYTKKIIPAIKSILPKIILILGGPEVSYNAQEWINNFTEIDFIIKSGGEGSFKFLIDNNFKIPGKIISEKSIPFKSIPLPYNEIDLKELSNKYIYYESTRGCPLKCSYCLSSREDQKLEFKEISTVKKELNFLIKNKPEIIKFIDRTFNIDKERYQEIWKHILKNNIKSRFHFEINPDLIDNSDMDILKLIPKETFQFEIGIQTINEKSLKEINRNINWLKIKDNIKYLISLKNIHIHLDLIAGLPYEDYKSLINSFNEIHKLMPDHFQCGFLKILPGTEMENKAVEYNMIYHKFPPYEVIQNKWITFKELSIFHKIEELVDNIYNSKTFKTTIKNLLFFMDSPFQMYLNILEFMKSKNISHKIKDWKKISSIILSYSTEDDNIDQLLIIDSLRWDWCNNFPGKGYPEELSSSFTNDIKIEGQKKLSNLIESGKILFEKKDIGKIIYFSPESLTFKSQMNLNSKFTAFLLKNAVNTIATF